MNSCRSSNLVRSLGEVRFLVLGEMSGELWPTAWVEMNWVDHFDCCRVDLEVL